MQSRWLGKNVDLEVLSQRIQAFLEGKGFRAKLERSANGWIVLGVIPHGDLRCIVTVRVDGSPNDFLVEILGGESKLRLLLGAFASMFGGGVFYLRKLKLQEFFEKFEVDFSYFLEETVASLAG